MYNNLKVTRDEKYADIVRSVLEYVNTDLSHPVILFTHVTLESMLMLFSYRQLLCNIKSKLQTSGVTRIARWCTCVQDGGFYSAEDADSLPKHDSTEKKEGAFCVWTKQEVTSLLCQPIEGKDGVTAADVFCYHYDVRDGGNVDPMQVVVSEHYLPKKTKYTAYIGHHA